MKNKKLLMWFSVIVSILVATTSLLGIFYEKTYSREAYAWVLQALGQDYANLLVVVILLVSTYFMAKNSLKAYFIWLGTYIYLVYAFFIYAIAIHFQFLFLVYVAILGLSFYTLILGLMAADIEKISKLSLANIKIKLVSGLLMFIGVMFALLWLSEIIPNLLASTIPQVLSDTKLWVNPVHVLDLGFLLPAMILVSVLLWQKKFWGYILAIPLLVFSISMGLGIIAIFIISAINGLPYSLPAGIMVSTIIILSTYFSFLFIRDIK